MSKATFFVQECPTCGRRLQIRLEYLGKSVQCEHCDGSFEASDSASQQHWSDSGTALLERANELLESASAPRQRPR